MYTRITTALSFLLMAAILGGCEKTETVVVDRDSLGIPWVRSAAEYDALTMQTYQVAARNLDVLLADKSWSAMPGQQGAESLPPAIILDVDETSLSNIGFQEQLLKDGVFSHREFDRWHINNAANRMFGAPEFIALAREKGVEVFFITNRPCQPLDFAAPGPCPQEGITLQDLAESGIATDADHLMLVGEEPDWEREKRGRQELIARSHRVIMLFGDDLGDFLPCVRAKPVAPCPAASAADRDRLTLEYGGYWGFGWYMLPNPMHGSWTSYIETGNPEDEVLESDD
jgi:acid phosphatase